MEEELKEVWTTLIRPVTRFSNNDYYRRKDKGQIKAYNNLSEYKPTYLPVGAIGYDGSNKTYRQLKTIKVRNSDGSFDYYMVPEFAVEGVYVDKPKPVVEPILNLAPLSSQSVVQTLQVHNDEHPKSNAVSNLTSQKLVTTKSNSVVKLPVPLNLLPYIANVTSDGVLFFNIPDGYTPGLFEQAVKAVYGLNKGLAQKPMAYYLQPQQLILQQLLQLLAALLSLKLYLIQRQQIALLSLKQRLLYNYRLNMKYNTNNNAQVDKKQTENTDNPDLVTEVFAYPYRRVDVYNIHPEAYQKVLEYLKNNFDKDNNNNELDGYVLSLSGFEKIPIGGEVNDSTFHYIGKNGKHDYTWRRYYENANIINKNEIFSKNLVPKNIILDNGKLKMYSYLNNDNVVYKNNDGTLIRHPFVWRIGEKVNDYLYDLDDEVFSDLREKGLTELLINDYINKNLNYLDDTLKYNVDKSIFRPVEKELTTLNNSTLLTSNSGNVVLKVKQTAKLTASKIRNFFGFLNGGQLKYYKNGK